MNIAVSVLPCQPAEGGQISIDLHICTSLKHSFAVNATLDFAQNAATINNNIKQIAHTALQTFHNVTVQPSDKTFLIGGVQ
jgi:hypothetical protein